MGSDDGRNYYYATLDAGAAKAMARLRSVSADGNKDEIVARLEAQDEATGTAPWKADVVAADTAVGEASASAGEKSTEDDGLETIRRGKKTRPQSGEVKESFKSKETEEVEELKEVDDDEKPVDAKETAEPVKISEVAASSTIEPEAKMVTLSPTPMKDLQDEWDSQWGGSKPVDTKDMKENGDPSSSFAAIAKKTSEKAEAPASTIAEPRSASSSTPAGSDAPTESSSRSITPATDVEVVDFEKKEDATSPAKVAPVQEKELPSSSNGSEAGESAKKKKRSRGGKKAKAKKAAEAAEGSQTSVSSNHVDAVEESQDIPTTSSPAPMESSEPTPEATEATATTKGDATESFPGYIDVSQPADINDGAILEPSPSVAPTEVDDVVADEVTLDLSEEEKFEDAKDLQDPSLFNRTRPSKDTQEVVKPSAPAKKMAINPISIANVGKKETSKAPEPVDIFSAPASPAPSSSNDEATSSTSELPKKFNKKSGKARKEKANAFVALATGDDDGQVEAMMPGDDIEHAAPAEEEGAEVVAVKKAKKRGKKAKKKAKKTVEDVKSAEGWKFNPVHFGVTVGVVGVLGGLVGLWMKG
jgi:hypothetical protein